ncbi:hypothetical protein BpHYR1_009318 [Brachionus plicatilis]|uniref:Uncharacterized protein n=1 Tax=Brachionus plicatilis TaxID=10195 RepID=A0A3M7SZV8_BRAPC|nr:hypothetical protein BpHYR1_009318 [Brachionus plicatilis]
MYFLYLIVPALEFLLSLLWGIKNENIKKTNISLIYNIPESLNQDSALDPYQKYRKMAFALIRKPEILFPNSLFSRIQSNNLNSIGEQIQVTAFKLSYRFLNLQLYLRVYVKQNSQEILAEYLFPYVASNLNENFKLHQDNDPINTSN